MNDQQALNALLRSNLHPFIVKCFYTISPGTQYHDNWHIQAIAYELTRCLGGEQHRLLITQPPRSLKSICSSVASVAWALGKNPSQEFICVSYSQDLAQELSRQFRLVVESPWYRALFPKMRLAKNTEGHIITTQGGGRYATSIGGTLTGRGADFIIIDDPLKAEDAQSETARKKVIDWYRYTLLSRFNDPQNGVLILVMQRLHEEDLAGAEAQGWPKLNLPAIATEVERIAIAPGEYHERHPGDLLHEARLPHAYLMDIKRDIGSMPFSAQYQQAPIPAEGNLVKRRWFKWFIDVPAQTGQIYQSWDVAATLTGDYSVCTTWKVIKKDYYLIDLWRDRLEFPALKRKAIALAQQYKPHGILVEKIGVGISLHDELRDTNAQGVPKPIAIKPHNDKVSRLEGGSARIEAGQVYLPKDVPWLDTFLNELLGFPNTKYDDQVDSTSQFLEWIKNRERHTPTVGMGPVLFVGDGNGNVTQYGGWDRFG